MQNTDIILSMMFQHLLTHNVLDFAPQTQCIVLLEHRKFFVSVIQSCSFWNFHFELLQSKLPEENDKAISDNFCRLKVVIPFEKSFTGDMYVSTTCCMCIIHFAIAPTHLLKNLSWQIMSASHLNMTCTAGEWAASNMLHISKVREAISRRRVSQHMALHGPHICNFKFKLELSNAVLLLANCW